MLIRTLFLTSIFASSVYADIPYCSGTQVQGSKHQALQKVVKAFARENHCVIDKNCLLNFDDVKYAIVWAKGCPDSAQRGNDPSGSTFTCYQGVCTPFGFLLPEAFYDENQKK